jgi:hypothetical protein
MVTNKPLSQVSPELSEEWHPSKNGDLKPSDIAPFSHKKVWWLGKCGHEFSSEVASRMLGRGCGYCSGQKVLIGFNDLATTRPDVAAEWHPTLNTPLLPTEVTSGSTAKKVWWLGKCGHHWQSTPAAKSNQRGCPYCSGQAVLEGFNDLATTRPDVAAEWHPTLNSPLLSSEVMAGTYSKKVWWLGKCGHHWQSTPGSRCEGSGCNVCASKELVAGVNDMGSTHPILAKEFDHQLNSPLKPSDVFAGTNTKLHWVCPLGHKYSTSGNKRTVRGDGCPICSRKQLLIGVNDLATTHPQLAISWGDSNSFSATSITSGSSKKVFWKCPKGHPEYFSAAKNRLRGQGCPVCQNKSVQSGVTDLATIFPSLSLEWDYELNSANPEEVAPYSHKKFWWTCASHGSYQSSAAHRANGRGCPGCATTGYDSSKPGIFYFIEQDKLGAKKFGITNVSSREDRLKGFRNLGWVVLLQIESSNGSEIAELERAIFSWVRKELSLPVYLSRQDIGKIGGWTETLSADGLDSRVGIAKVHAELERLRNLNN